MITTEQAKQQLASVGIDNLPDFLIDAMVEQVNSINECLDEHYSAGTALLIQAHLISLIGMAQGHKYISSQSAPSGASRSFRWANLSDVWRGTLSLLRGLDKSGCTDGLIPADPTKKAYAGVWVSKGNNCCGG